MKTSYKWLQKYFEDDLPEPEKISEGITFHSFEIEETESKGNDFIFDIKVLPDRAHDCLSHWGIAKEISAFFDLKIKEPNKKEIKSSPTNLKIEINDKNCLRYIGRIIRNVKVGDSPAWLKEKLEAIGQKSINNIVDSANYVMFDIGQPIHCFDLDKLENEKLIIRKGKEGEKLTTLDKKDVKLDESILVIADEKDALAVAGIKGGTKAEVDNQTKNIVIEVANFNAVSTRKTSKKIGILTDAVKRYENEISPELCEKAMEQISKMLLELAEGEAEEVIDIYPEKAKQNIIFITLDYINKRLGTNFSKEEIERVFEKLNFEYEEEGGEFKIFVPLLRLDLIGPHDLVEDIIKLLGYEKITGIFPKINFIPKENKKFNQILQARNKLLSEGYNEVMTYVFRNKGEVEVLASASDKKFLRTNLTEGLKESLKLNQLNAPLLELNDVKVFEIGTVFMKGKEEMHVAFGNKKEIKEMKIEEFCGEDTLEDLHKILEVSVSNSDEKKFQIWSIYPFISRDIAVWVPEGENPEKIRIILKENGTQLLVKEPYLFDSFTKEGKTSFAFRLVFQSFDRTLKDEEINEIMANITNKIKENTDWQVR